MKLTQKAITAYVRHQLSTNPVWAVKALVRIFQENQTQQEQAIEATKEDNGIGFTGTDGNILSSFAKSAIKYAKTDEKGNIHYSVTPKMLTIVFKKMPKYHKQVIAFSNPEQLHALVAKANAS